MYAERPWAYPMEKPKTGVVGRPNEVETPENIARCNNCPMIKLGYADCKFESVKACKRAERLETAPAKERHKELPISCGMMPRAHMKRVGA